MDSRPSALSRPSARALRVLCALFLVAASVPWFRPFLANALVQRSTTYAAAGQPGIASRYLARAAWIDPKAQMVGQETAFLAGLSNNPAERQRDLAIAQRYIKAHPNDVESWESIFLAAWRLHDRPLALQAARAIRRLGPTATPFKYLENETLAGKWYAAR